MAPHWRIKDPAELKKYTFWMQFKDSWKYSVGFRAVLIASAIMAILAAALSVLPSFLYGKIVEDLSNGSFGLIYVYIGLIAGSHLFYSLFDRLIDHFSYMNNLKVRHKLNIDFYNNLFKLDFDFFEKNSPGIVMSQIRDGTHNLRIFLKIFYRRFMMGVFIFLFSLMSLVYLNVWVVVTGLVVVVFYQLWIYLTNMKKLELEYIHSITKDASQGKIMDYLSRIQLVKLLNIKRSLIKELKKSHNLMYRTAKKARSYMNKKVFVEKVLMRVPDAIVLLILAVSFMNGNIEIGALVTAYALYTKFLSGYSQMHDQYSDILNTRPALFKLSNLSKLKPAVEEPKNPKEIKEWNEIKFENVNFNYSGKKEKALDNVSFEVNKGEKLAFVGMSGSGKSTIAKLLFRMYLPQEGSMKIGEVEIKDVKSEDLYELMKMVPQENELINTSIYDNLKLGSSKRTSKEEMIAALKKSESYDFVNGLPKKLQTLVGPNGIRVSGGEKQRLCIARALLSEPEVLVLDEATSHLDVLTEKKIHDELHNLSENQTVIAITHRISSMYLFDRIIVMDQGKIVGEGTHSKLLATNPYYQKLWRQSKKV